MATGATYQQETDGIIVRVEPSYLPDESEPDESRHVWSYTVEIENSSGDAVQLLSRAWRITDANGVVQTVEGPGVVGQQPIIEPGEKFRYSSACPLSTESGMMVGSYRMMRSATGERFDIAVPAFALDSPVAPRYAN